MEREMRVLAIAAALALVGAMIGGAASADEPFGDAKAAQAAFEKGDNVTAIRLYTQAMEVNFIRPEDLAWLYDARAKAYLADVNLAAAHADLDMLQHTEGGAKYVPEIQALVGKAPFTPNPEAPFWLHCQDTDIAEQYDFNGKKLAFDLLVDGGAQKVSVVWNPKKGLHEFMNRPNLDARTMPNAKFYSVGDRFVSVAQNAPGYSYIFDKWDFRESFLLDLKTGRYVHRMHTFVVALKKIRQLSRLATLGVCTREDPPATLAVGPAAAK